ncbi:hypothetical protein VD0002_g8098 [Verticillium dahliae]|uniref:Uncharacterized protein n=2 Tax=Verticillium dahliae TaxID=27337 RepID=G2XI88_VERDV|nr:uncharacterized protein VDAG_09870 [Verticillium dahliae VdLs.17]KAF3347310.1 Alpha-glucosides permease MPH3 [Verticillium dahliae VDG2]KAH6701849.1 hypothetical protein EV126DRAFT_400207 [Verticillium dahliae]EGY19536.1 hypothetical protein VDAG_09870 [Verticillium dahliae VdLs.17]PNH29745.1 hypothetical protein BJF96_g6939 [Verticillium dahliae]PNH51621.1 hypothetical protein VD0003_g5660 [Verticillium dahliae]
MAQPHPTLINLPPPGSNPDTPSEMPGTPTSTTTSMSALSTTAIKDGQRGHLPHGHTDRGHTHNPSTQSLEAERADRISRLAGLERVSTLRASGQQQLAGGVNSFSPQTASTSTYGFPPNNPNPTPAYFDAQGQPTAATKMSTVGTASATASYAGGDDETRTAPGDRDEDLQSTDTNYRGSGSVTSVGEPEHMDEDIDGAARSVGGYEDRMSDDGSASLVGFGEGANSTVSGPIYHRRPIPGLANAQSGSGVQWGLERNNSGLSDTPRSRGDVIMGGDTPTSAAAMQQRRDAKFADGFAAETGRDEDMFVDPSNRTPGSAGQSPFTAQPPGAQQAFLPGRMPTSTARDAVERMVGAGGLDGSESRGAAQPGQFEFEERK